MRRKQILGKYWRGRNSRSRNHGQANRKSRFHGASPLERLSQASNDSLDWGGARADSIFKQPRFVFFVIVRLYRPIQ
jgi:hypothetical protein